MAFILSYPVFYPVYLVKKDRPTNVNSLRFLSASASLVLKRQNMTETQDTITGTVENLAFGGSGILKQAGLVVFVPFTAPGRSRHLPHNQAQKKLRPG